VHEHENFRLKTHKGNGRGRIREGKERGRSGYFVQGPPEFLVMPLCLTERKIEFTYSGLNGSFDA